MLVALLDGDWREDADRLLPFAHAAVEIEEGAEARDVGRGDAPGMPRIAALSTYLGHVNPGKTYWYLHAAPELLELASRRLQRHLGAGE